MESESDLGTDSYRAIGEWYDAEHDPIVDDVGLYLQLAEIVGGPILELGCGSGRILRPLAEAGHDVTGVDRSPEMLERARARLSTASLPGSWSLLESEMDRLPPGQDGRFGLILLSHNTLLHATSTEAQRAVLSAAREALDPRGMIVIDVINPIADLSASEDGRLVVEGTWASGDGSRITKVSSRVVDQAAQSIVTDIWYDELRVDGLLRRTAARLRLRYVLASELLLLLELSGFVEPQLYGSYDLEPYTETSPRIIVTAEATAS